MKTEAYKVWSVGKGGLWYGLERYAQLFDCPNAEAELILKSLNIIPIRKGNQKMVNHFAVLTALHAVSWIGKPGFNLGEDQLDPADMMDYDEMLSLILFCQRLGGVDVTEKASERVRKAVKQYRVCRNALHKAALLDAETRKILPPLPPHMPMEINVEHSEEEE